MNVKKTKKFKENRPEITMSMTVPVSRLPFYLCLRYGHLDVFQNLRRFPERSPWRTPQIAFLGDLGGRFFLGIVNIATRSPARFDGIVQNIEKT